MVSIAKKLNRRATRADLEALPRNVKGEIIGGELYVQPRPRPRHSRAAVIATSNLMRGYGGRPGDPPGWWILLEPGIELPEADELAPDIAGWRRTRLPQLPADDPITIAPDWVCEVLSPSNRSFDRKIKFPLYASIGVSHLWVIDPPAFTVEIKRLSGSHWIDVATFAEDDVMCAEPFTEIEIALADLWLP